MIILKSKKTNLVNAYKVYVRKKNEIAKVKYHSSYI